MQLPRWTAYLALALLAVVVVTAIPWREPHPTPRGAAEAARAGDAAETTYRRVVVLGIDGMDPEILTEVCERYPERMPNFRKLIADGPGVLELQTSNPPQSSVAWSNFITGRNPGGHGIYDFIHRDPKTYAPVIGTTTPTHPKQWNLPGKWRLPLDEGGDPNRSGKAFWTILGEAGVPADVWRMPINFPVEEGKGWSFSGMMTPALDSAYGQPSLYTENPPLDVYAEADSKTVPVKPFRGRIDTILKGPNNAFLESGDRENLPFTIHLNKEVGAAIVEIAGQTLVVEPGEWTSFVPVNFSMLPMWMMEMGGIVRFYLRSLEPFEMYASPINYDPEAPVAPVSAPASASAELAKAIGRYYTQGMAEDVNGLKSEYLTDEEFMRQAMVVYGERNDMLGVALDRYMAREDGGLLFFYYSTIDLCGHMMWRLSDPQHPFYDPEIAGRSSEWFSQREGSTWQDVIHDLYMKLDPVLGRVRERVGEDTLILVISDHGFAPYRRKFSLNRWLVDEGYLVLEEGKTPELARDDPAFAKVMIYGVGKGEDGKKEFNVVDWSRTRAYGMGFNGLYLNLADREKEGIVKTSEADALIAEIRAKLEAVRDPENLDADGRPAQVIRRTFARDEIYTGERVGEAPDLVVGYNSEYGNSDESSEGRIPSYVLADNKGGTFNGSHLMDPAVVNGVLVTNGIVSLEKPTLADLTVEVLSQYGIEPDEEMEGRPVLQKQP